MANDDGELRGIGGWLTFFLITLGLISPLSILASVGMLTADAEAAAAYGPLWGRLMALEWTVTGISVLAAWGAVWQLVDVQRWRSVRLTVGVLWLLAFLALVGEPVGVMLMTGFSYGDMFGEAPGEFVRPLVYSSVWTTYLLRSKRVANTYPADGTGDEAVDAFE